MTNQPPHETPEDAPETMQENEQNGTKNQNQPVRDYTLNRARRKLDVHRQTIDRALEADVLTSYVDEENVQRIPAYEIENALDDEILYAQIEVWSASNCAMYPTHWM